METTGNTRFISPLLDHFTTDPLETIDQDAVIAACRALYPTGSPQTWNRQVFTPVNAILTLASKQGKCAPPSLTRPKGHDALPVLNIPDDAWFDAVLPHCNERTRALLVMLAISGRRISELVSIKSADVRDGVVQIGRTKNGAPVLLTIPDTVLVAMDDWQSRERLFGYASRFTFTNALRRACKRAGVRYYSSHKVGRHFASSRILREGHSLKFLQAALGWKSIAMPAKRYGHLERSEIEETMHSLGQSWVKDRKVNGDN